jgi:NAD(P)-dependent dehydrogenase (short-subunit alcohol dehydrogenase family)
MAVKLKKLSEQVIVITGASSGIGLVTARLAAKRGAGVVLNARSEDALRWAGGVRGLARSRLKPQRRTSESNVGPSKIRSFDHAGK